MDSYVIGVQEPWDDWNGTRKQKLFERIYRPQGNGKPRAALYSKGVKILPVSWLSSKDLAVGVWDGFSEEKETVYVASWYSERKDQILPATTRRLIQHTSSKGIPLIVCADVNAWSPI